MSQKLINLTLRLVNQEVEDVLKDCPKYPYQVALSTDELRNKLIDSILIKTPNYYAMVENESELPKDLKSLYCSSKEQEQMKTLIRKSIFYIVQENSERISR